MRKMTTSRGGSRGTPKRYWQASHLHMAPVPCRNNNYCCCFIHVVLMLLLACCSRPPNPLAPMAYVSGHFLRRASLYDGLQLRGSIAGRCCPLSPLIDQGTRESRSIPNQKKIIHNRGPLIQHIQQSSPVKPTVSPSDEPARTSTSTGTRLAGLGSTQLVELTRLDRAEASCGSRPTVTASPSPSPSLYLSTRQDTHKTTTNRWDQSRVRQLQHQNTTQHHKNTHSKEQKFKVAGPLAYGLSSHPVHSIWSTSLISPTSLKCLLSAGSK